MREGQLQKENKIRFKFTKTEEFKYLSHLDIIRIISRAVRRAGIKVKYSQGYNPRPKMSFSPPTPLGVESLAEYGDISPDCRLSAAGFMKKVNRKLKTQMKIVDALVIPYRTKNLMADIAVIQYRFIINCPEPKDKAGFLSFRQALAGLKSNTIFGASIFRLELEDNMAAPVEGISGQGSPTCTLVLNLYGYVTIFKGKNNKIFKFNDFLIFFRDWLQYWKAEAAGCFKAECLVIREHELKNPLEVAES